MSSRPLRFLQAGDFLLHQPICGLPDVPDHLASWLIEAPYRAAERVFDAALAAAVDFVLLAGTLCSPRRSGPRGPVFLIKQFSRLAERGIAVYWAAGEGDQFGDFPQLLWPANVRVLSSDRVEHVVHHRDGVPVCQIAGRSAADHSSSAARTAGAYAPSPDGLFAIAVTAGAPPGAFEELPAIGNHYWACGGESQATTPLAELDRPCTVHFAGSPQGRSPRDLDPGGCTLVQAETESRDVGSGDIRHRIRLSRIATDVVRWHDEQLILPSSLEQADCERLLHERIGALIAAAPELAHLIRWKLEGLQSAADRSDHSALAANLLATLRSDYGFRNPPAWSVSLDLMRPDLPASWSEQQTLLGEFLRHIEALKIGTAGDMKSSNVGERPMEGYFDCLLSERHMQLGLAEMIEPKDTAAREAVLQQAAALGAELLAPSIVSQHSAHHRSQHGAAAMSGAHGDSSRPSETGTR